MRKRTYVLWILVLVLFDQAVKWCIYIKGRHFIDECTNIIGKINLHPTFNEDLNWMNAKWGIGMTRGTILLIAIIGLLLFGVMLIYCGYEAYIGKKYKLKAIYFIVLVMAGIISFLCDLMFLGYTLDYIELKGIGIFDIKDIYFIVGGVGLVIFSVYEEIRYRPKTKDEIKAISLALKWWFKNTE